MVDSDTIFISEKNIKLLRDLFRPKQKAFGKGEMILEKNRPKQCLCLLLKGTAYLCMENESGSKQLLDYFTRGQLLYQEMLPAPDNGHCFIQAKYPCTAAYLSHQELLEHILKQADRELAELLSAMLRSAVSAGNQHCHILQQKTIRGKLLAFLHSQKIRQQSSTLHIPMPYSDLADYLAIDRSSLMTELSRMHAEGLIEKKTRTIVLREQSVGSPP